MSAPAYGSLPFTEQIRFFRRKLNLPTRSWTDIYTIDHDKAFVVAGANCAELVADFRRAVDKAIADGTTRAEFQRDFDRIVAKHGWSYNGSRGWRSRIIYETNLRTAYAAGRYQQLQAVKQERPYWEFHHTVVENPRPRHVHWDGLILHADDPWWAAHYPPDGWGCQCVVFSRSRRDLARRGKSGPDPAPPVEYETRTIGQNGPTPRTVRVPKGVDPGFEYTPGKSVVGRSMRHYMTRAAELPPDIAAQSVLSMLSRERLLSALQTEYQGWVNAVRTNGQANGEHRVIGALRPDTLDGLTRRGHEPNTVGIIMRDRDLLHIARDAKRRARTASGQPKGLTDADIDALPRTLVAPAAVLYDNHNGSLVYVFNSTGGRTGKIAVHIDFATKVRDPSGARISDLFNVVRSGGQVDINNLGTRQYTLLEGKL